MTNDRRIVGRRCTRRADDRVVAVSSGSSRGAKLASGFVFKYAKPFWPLVVLTLYALSAAAAPNQSTAPSQHDEAPLANSDVVKLTKLGLGDQIVIGKINQAPTIAFDLSTDGLVQLKNAGVTANVIAAMLERATHRQSAPQPAPDNSGTSADANRYDIRLLTVQGPVALPSNRGDITTTGFWPVVMTFLDYPGLHARTRTKNVRPVLVIRTEHDPTNYYYLCQLDVNDQEDNNRSLKIALDADAFSATARIIPAGRWHVKYTVSEPNPGVRHITPARDLKPGEYGVVVPGGILYEFGID